MSNCASVAERRVPTPLDVVVIGAGFAGLYAHHKFRELGLSAFGFEAAPDVGGTQWIDFDIRIPVATQGNRECQNL